MNVRAGIVGGTGYGALELLRLLAAHPQVQVARVYSRGDAGRSLGEVYPHLAHLDLRFAAYDPQTAADEVEVLFFATPAGVCGRAMSELAAAGALEALRVIDLSGDLRLPPDEYREWYREEPAPAEFSAAACYGLSEYNRAELAGARLVSNPGCFATAALLGALPALGAGLAEAQGVVIDGKSGVSGAGRTPGEGTHFPAANENVTPYKPGRHQHVPEIERYLTRFGELPGPARVLFQPHLLPLTRGLMCNVYLRTEASETELRAAYADAYAGAPFVRLRPAGAPLPGVKDVAGSNFCDIGLHRDERSGLLQVVSVIDNLGKGAAGQAVQNMNLTLGLPEDAGLGFVPVYP